MKTFILAAAAAIAATTLAAAADTPDRVKLEVTKEQLATIGNGIMELPYKTAAPLMVELQRQIEAQTPKPAEAPKPESSKPEAPEQK